MLYVCFICLYVRLWIHTHKVLYVGDWIHTHKAVHMLYVCVCIWHTYIHNRMLYLFFIWLYFGAWIHAHKAVYMLYVCVCMSLQHKVFHLTVNRSLHTCTLSRAWIHALATRSLHGRCTFAARAAHALAGRWFHSDHECSTWSAAAGCRSRQQQACSVARWRLKRCLVDCRSRRGASVSCRS